MLSEVKILFSGLPNEKQAPMAQPTFGKRRNEA
jgi:hypothetical protein